MSFNLIWGTNGLIQGPFFYLAWGQGSDVGGGYSPHIVDNPVPAFNGTQRSDMERFNRL